MKMKWSMVIIIILIIMGLLVVGALNSGCALKNYPDDNLVEEIVEEVIEEETGLDIDLSPFSREYNRVSVKMT